MSVQGFFFRSIIWAVRGARNWPLADATVYTYRWNYSSDAESPNHHSDLTTDLNHHRGRYGLFGRKT